MLENNGWINLKALLKFFQKNIIQYIFLFLLFLILSVWFTKIPLKSIGSVLPAGGDPYLVTYIWSWEMHIIPSDFLNLFNANIFAPFKNTLAFTEHMLGSLILAWPLFLIFKNIILVFNIISLSSFAISGLGMYLLAYYLSKNKLASLVAAFIYAFAPLKIHHLEHINLTGMWLPCFFLYLEKFFNKQTWKNIVLLTFFVILVFLNAMQYFLFLPIVIILFLLKNILIKKFRFNKNNIVKIFISIFIFLIIAIPILMPYLQVKQDFDFQRKVETIEGLSPDLFDYFISPFFYKYFYPAFFSEWAIGPGIFVLLLLIFLSIFIYRKTDKFKNYLVYYLIGLIAVLFSFGYFIQFTRSDPSGIIGPWAFFYHFIPGFDGLRAIGRYSIFFLLSSGIIISLGLSEIFRQKIKNYKKQIILALVIIILLGTEFSFACPKKYVTVSSQVPNIYHWLGKQDDDKIYLEMPIGENYIYHHYDALHEYYSIYNFKKIINGFSGFVPEEYKKINKQLRRFDINDLGLIKNYGATHIIFHFDYYPKNFKDKTIKKLEQSGKVKLIRQIDNDFVYEIL